MKQIPESDPTKRNFDWTAHFWYQHVYKWKMEVSMSDPGQWMIDYKKRIKKSYESK